MSMNCISFDLNNQFIESISNVGAKHIFSIAGIMKVLNENLLEKNKKDLKRAKKFKKFIGYNFGVF